MLASIVTVVLVRQEYAMCALRLARAGGRAADRRGLEECQEQTIETNVVRREKRFLLKTVGVLV